MTRTEKLLALVALGFIALRARPKPQATPLRAPGATPGAPGATPGAPGDGIELVGGQTYEASIRLSGIEATFGTASAVKSKLVAAGFRDVTVADHKGGNFTARGTWGKVSTRAKLPAQVKAVKAVGATTPAPVPVARIYQGPDDAFDTVRMSVETPGMAAREMGIFSNRAAAAKVAQDNGWTVAP